MCTRTYEGGCGNWDAKTLNMDYKDRPYTATECRNLCAEVAECGGFLLGTQTGTLSGYCFLMREGCSDDNNPNWDYYAMDDCTSGINVYIICTFH